MIYLSFDIASMLFWLNRYCKRVELCKVKDEYCLYVYSDEFGEYEKTGSLFHIISLAFKPFVDRAKNDRDLFNQNIDNITTG